MKKFIIIFLFFSVLQSCTSKSEPCDDKTDSNGFIKDTDQKIMLASDKAIDLFKQIDKAWFERDYEKIKTIVSKDATLRFANGDKGVGPQALIDLIEKEYQENINDGTGWEWSTDYAFSVKNSPTNNPKPGDLGEWVLAEFTTKKLNIIEWYQFNEGKLINWYQFNSLKK